MSTVSLIFFGVAFISYLVTWRYILQLVREVNRNSAVHRVSMWWWHKAWKVHKTLFPASSVRVRLLTCMVVTVGLGLIAFCIEARNLVLRLQPR